MYRDEFLVFTSVCVINTIKNYHDHCYSYQCMYLYCEIDGKALFSHVNLPFLSRWFLLFTLLFFAIVVASDIYYLIHIRSSHKERSLCRNYARVTRLKNKNNFCCEIITFTKKIREVTIIQFFSLMFSHHLSGNFLA